MNAGIIVPRGILAHPIYKDERAMRLLLHLMLLAAEAEVVAPPDSIMRLGAVRISQYDLALSLGWKRGAVKRALDRLRAADALVVTPHIGGSDEIICLYYKPASESGAAMKPIKARTPAAPAPKETIEERRAKFLAACDAIYLIDAARLPEHLRSEFTAYWMEPDPKGKMRFEAQPFFDHGRRMDTWRRKAGTIPNDSAPRDASAPWNPRG